MADLPTYVPAFNEFGYGQLWVHLGMALSRDHFAFQQMASVHYHGHPVRGFYRERNLFRVINPDNEFEFLTDAEKLSTCDYNMQDLRDDLQELPDHTFVVLAFGSLDGLDGYREVSHWLQRLYLEVMLPKELSVLLTLRPGRQTTTPETAMNYIPRDASFMASYITYGRHIDNQYEIRVLKARHEMTTGPQLFNINGASVAKPKPQLVSPIVRASRYDLILGDGVEVHY